MNMYEKINQIRVELQGIRKTGRNNHQGFSYYELADFLPTINNLQNKYGLTDNVSFTNDNVELLIIDTAEEQEMKFTLPFIRFEKGALKMQDIQHFGALLTYYRRYLYMIAYNISEGDVIDSVNQNEYLQATIDEYKNAINSAETIDELRNIWKKYQGRVPEQERTQHANERKAILESDKGESK